MMEGRYIYSSSLDEMVLMAYEYEGHIYVWNDIDCVYYDNTEMDESFYMGIPEGAIAL